MPSIFKKYFLFIFCLLMALDSACAIDQYDKIRSTSVNDPDLQAAAYEDHDAQEDEDCNDDASWTRQHGLTVAAGIVALAGLGIYFHNKQPVKRPDDSDQEKSGFNRDDSNGSDKLIPEALSKIPGSDELKSGAKPLLVGPPTSKRRPSGSGEGLLSPLPRDESSEQPIEDKKKVARDKSGAGSAELPYPNLELLRKAMSLRDGADRGSIDKQIRDNIDCTNAEGKTLLHLVASRKCVTAEVGMVIRYGANAWVLDANKKYAIDYIYSRWQDFNTVAHSLISDAMVRQRVDSGSVIVVKDPQIDHVLFFHMLETAYLKQKEKILKYIHILHDQQTFPTWYCKPEYYSRSVFEHMLSNDVIDEDIVKAVLDAKVNPNTQSDGYTFMHLLAENVVIAQIPNFPQKLMNFLEWCKPDLLIQATIGGEGWYQEEVTVVQYWERVLKAWEGQNWLKLYLNPQIKPKEHALFLRKCIKILEPIEQRQRDSKKLIGS